MIAKINNNDNDNVSVREHGGELLLQIRLTLFSTSGSLVVVGTDIPELVVPETVERDEEVPRQQCAHSLK